MLQSHDPFRGRASSDRSSTPTQNRAGSSTGVASRRHTPSPARSDNHDRSFAEVLPPPPADDFVSEELPPAYTPTADVRRGETTLDMGPRRPFQPPPGMPLRSQNQRYLSPIPTGPGTPGSIGSASWSSFPGVQRGLRTNATAPPVHPLLREPTRPSSAPHDTQPPLSDFAREFYAAGGAVPGPQQESSSSSSHHLDPDVPDDGRPTQQPTPGHPLLRHGKVLVYPGGYECDRCHNVGYRNNDPTTPCVKCWDKHGRPFSGALVYAPWNNSPSESTRHGYQRPLPRFTPPHLSLPASKHRPTQSYSGPASPAGPVPHARSASLARPQNGYAGASSRVIPIAGGGIAMGPYLDPIQRSPSTNIRVAEAPPPGATVYRPGDPRLGGRLCWRCGGSGTTTFLIFEEMPCGICNGVGRTYL